MKTVLITGASSGIGLATAEFLVQKGYQVFGTCRSIVKRQAIVDQMKTKHQDRFQFIEMDVTGDNSVKNGVQALLEKIGTLDALICNAGNGIYGSVEEMPLDKVRLQFETNFYGSLRLVQAVLPHMREKKSGHIILTSSIGGVVCIPFQAFYSASKYAIEALTQGLRQELIGSGVKVAAIRPGDIKTEFNDVTDIQMPENSPYKARCEKCWKTIDENMQIAPEPIIVARKALKILRSKNPKAYYTAADFLTSLTPLLTPLMTSKMKERVVRIFYGL